jgi:hypothetical protein
MVGQIIRTKGPKADKAKRALILGNHVLMRILQDAHFLVPVRQSAEAM